MDHKCDGEGANGPHCSQQLIAPSIIIRTRCGSIYTALKHALSIPPEVRYTDPQSLRDTFNPQASKGRAKTL